MCAECISGWLVYMFDRIISFFVSCLWVFIILWSDFYTRKKNSKNEKCNKNLQKFHWKKIIKKKKKIVKNLKKESVIKYFRITLSFIYTAVILTTVPLGCFFVQYFSFIRRLSLYKREISLKKHIHNTHNPAFAPGHEQISKKF